MNLSLTSGQYVVEARSFALGVLYAELVYTNNDEESLWAEAGFAQALLGEERPTDTEVGEIGTVLLDACLWDGRLGGREVVSLGEAMAALEER